MAGKSDVVHIRVPVTCPEFRPDHNGECLNCDAWYDAHDAATTYCNEKGESVSLSFFVEHVARNHTGCCTNLWRRLCRDCDRLIPRPPVKE